jgi:hypothetical protein
MPENVICTAKGDRILREAKKRKMGIEKTKKCVTLFLISLDFSKYLER